MKRKVGRPRKKRVEEKPEVVETIETAEVLEVPASPEPPAPVSTEGLCWCGQPLAEGQNQVCKSHIRAV